MESSWAQLLGLETIGAIVLRDDSAAGFDVGEKPGEICGEVGALIEGADADHDGIEAAEFFGGEIGAFECGHGIAELLKPATVSSPAPGR